MAAATMMNISPDLKPVAGASNLTLESLAETSRFLQENHKHHAFFNAMGFHDHVAHHMLSLYALGATPSQIRAQFERNSPYQRGLDADPKPASVGSVNTTEGFMTGLGQRGAYADYLAFFGEEIEAKGVLTVLDQYLFADTELAKAMLSRVNSSIIHPIIHLGLSIEFELPGMTAEALGWTAVHQDEMGSFNTACQAVDVSGQSTSTGLLDLYLEIQKRGKNALVDIATKYRVTEENLEARIHEAINVEAYVTLSAQRRPYAPKLDFFLIHGHNATVYYPALLKTLGPKRTAILLERQVRATLSDYVSWVNAPTFDIEWLNVFVKDPSKQGGGIYNTWEEVFAKVNSLNDDGHIVKAVRALKGAEQAAGKQTQFKEPLKGSDFLGFAGVFVRSVENEGDFVDMKGVTKQWVRAAGNESAWEACGVHKVE